MQLIDISNVNGNVNWYKVRLAGVGGVWLKATEGATYVDTNFNGNKSGAKKALLRVGAYHFARPDHNSPEVEAEHFMHIAGKPGKRDLRPVLDMETNAHVDLEDWARRFNKQVRSHWGITPIFYSYPAYIQSMKPKAPIGDGLWIASYSVNDGRRHLISIPKPWKHYVAHQYTSSGSVYGVRGKVDRSFAPKVNGILAYPKGVK